MAAQQLSLSDVELQEKQARIRALAAELDALYKGVAAGIGRRQFAALTDKSYTYINEILNTNGDGKPFQPEMIAALLVEAPDEFFMTVVNFMCESAAREYPRKKRLMTAEEENRLLWNKIRMHQMERLFEAEMAQSSAGWEPSAR